MKQLVFNYVFEGDETLPQSVTVASEEAITKVLLRIFAIRGKVFPVVLDTCLGEDIKLCYRACRAVKDLPINPLTGRQYDWFTYNIKTHKIDGTYTMGTGRVISILK